MYGGRFLCRLLCRHIYVEVGVCVSVCMLMCRHIYVKVGG